jgi:hypothetical protein
MTMIYMLKGGPFNGDYLEGYVTNFDDVYKIAVKHYERNFYCADEGPYTINTVGDSVIIIDPNGFKIHFYIVIVTELLETE